MKPWGSQATVLHFLPPNLPAGQRRWLAGGPGGGKERPWPPHGGGELCGTDASPTADRHNALGMHATIGGGECGRRHGASSCGGSWCWETVIPCRLPRPPRLAWILSAFREF